MLTMFVGFWYWSQIYVAANAHRMEVSPGSTIGLFLLIWRTASGILYFLISKTPSGNVVGTITALLVWVAGRLPVGQDDNHVLSFGIGGGLGFIMLFNVWGIIWCNNKQIIRGTLAGTPGQRGGPGAAGVSGFTDEFLAVRAHDLFHGGEFALHDSGAVGGQHLASQTRHFGEAEQTAHLENTLTPLWLASGGEKKSRPLRPAFEAFD